MKLHLKNTFSVLLLVLLLLQTTPSLAKTYLGSGGTSCSEYSSIKKTMPEIGTAIDLWVLGYISGLNFLTYSTKKVDLLTNESATSVIGFIQGYCSVNTKMTLNNAANEYWIHLAELKNQ